MPRIEIIYPLLVVLGFGIPALLVFGPRHRRIRLVGLTGFVFLLLGWIEWTGAQAKMPPQWLPGTDEWRSRYFDHVRQLSVALGFATLCAVLIASSSLKNREAHRSCANGFDRLARRQRFCIALIGLSALVLGALLSAINLPVPRVHDEFSYLLAADTFAHGRLTNPTHPEWIHFESFHIFHQPTYMSKYPPAQGLILALGKVITGTPVTGIWLGTAFGCAATFWMLYGWLPPRWAFLGGLLTLLSPTIQNNWGQSFQGGGIAMGGGALAFGALTRILKLGGTLNAAILAAGISILAISRPFEGVVTVLPLGLVFTAWLISGRGGSRYQKLTYVALPFAAVMAVAFTAIAFDNWSVTGSPMRFPYQNDEDRYWTRNAFGLQIKTEPIVYNDPVIREFYESIFRSDQPENADFKAQISRAWNHLSKRIIWVSGLFYLRLHLAIPLLCALLGLRKGRVAFAALTLLLVLLAHSFVLFYWPHYSAPAACLLFFLIAEGLRRLWVTKTNVGRVLFLGVILTSTLELVAAGWHRQDPTPGFHLNRARIESELEASPERHLILVRYSESHDPSSEWVYNRADPDGAKVVWARDRGEDHNQTLLEHFRGRVLWRLNADDPEPKLEPLAPTKPSSPS